MRRRRLQVVGLWNISMDRHACCVLLDGAAWNSGPCATTLPQTIHAKLKVNVCSGRQLHLPELHSASRFGFKQTSLEGGSCDPACCGTLSQKKGCPPHCTEAPPPLSRLRQHDRCSSWKSLRLHRMHKPCLSPSSGRLKTRPAPVATFRVRPAARFMLMLRRVA